MKKLFFVLMIAGSLSAMAQRGKASDEPFGVKVNEYSQLVDHALITKNAVKDVHFLNLEKDILCAMTFPQIKELDRALATPEARKVTCGGAPAADDGVELIQPHEYTQFANSYRSFVEAFGATTQH